MFEKRAPSRGWFPSVGRDLSTHCNATEKNARSSCLFLVKVCLEFTWSRRHKSETYCQVMRSKRSPVPNHVILMPAHAGVCCSEKRASEQTARPSVFFRPPKRAFHAENRKFGKRNSPKFVALGPRRIFQRDRVVGHPGRVLPRLTMQTFREWLVFIALRSCLCSDLEQGIREERSLLLFRMDHSGEGNMSMGGWRAFNVARLEERYLDT